jgi:hypothetical protein
MFPHERQVRLDKVLDALREAPGVAGVQQDDFDSASINIIVSLNVAARGTIRSRTRPLRFATPIRLMKTGVSRACKTVDACFRFLDWPVKRYEPDGSGGKLDDGYNHEEIKIEVMV